MKDDNRPYLMESTEEHARLSIKTDEASLLEQVVWAGLKPGMSVADVGCGPGRTTDILCRYASAAGPVPVIGIDRSSDRLGHAAGSFSAEGLRFIEADVRKPLMGLGTYDFVFVRFLLEYYREESFEIARNISSLVKPGGIFCLADLDHNSLNYYGLPGRLDERLKEVMDVLQARFNFDPYAGRKLYSHLFRLGLSELGVQVSAHHLVYGNISPEQDFNWRKKTEVVLRQVAPHLGISAEEAEDLTVGFMSFLREPGTFLYTPLICCRGRKTVGT